MQRIWCEAEKIRYEALKMASEQYFVKSKCIRLLSYFNGKEIEYMFKI